MNKLYKWLYNKMNKAVEREYHAVSGSMKSVAVDPDHSLGSSSGSAINFSVYKANGGYVVEHRHYNRKSDYHSSKLHIVTEDKDLGEEIGKIITFESLRS